LYRRTPITDVLARPELDPEVRERLTLVLQVREFARDTLDLRVGDSYATFAEVSPDEAAVWVVSAARRDHLGLYTWWDPITGRVPYPGFFGPARADAEASRLATSDLDTDVRRALAFSTLGWFADPLLSTTAAAPPVDLAETVLHELFHATVYVPGAAAFNESAANMVGHRGAIAFFCPAEELAPAACAQARASWAAELRRGAVMGRLREKLERLYARHPAPAVRETRRAWLAAAAERALGEQGAGPGQLVPPNNARLLGELLYLTSLDRLDRLAPPGADLAPAIRTLAAEAPGARDPFELLPPAPSVASPGGVPTAAR